MRFSEVAWLLHLPESLCQDVAAAYLAGGGPRWRFETSGEWVRAVHREGKPNHPGSASEMIMALDC